MRAYLKEELTQNYIFFSSFTLILFKTNMTFFHKEGTMQWSLFFMQLQRKKLISKLQKSNTKEINMFFKYLKSS